MTLNEIMSENYRVEGIKVFAAKVDGWMYGDDECFDNYGFYQFFVNVDAGEVFIYRLYYDVTDGAALDTIDYDNPVKACWMEEPVPADAYDDELSDIIRLYHWTEPWDGGEISVYPM